MDRFIQSSVYALSLLIVVTTSQASPINTEIAVYQEEQKVNFVPIAVGDITVIFPVGSGIPPDPGAKGNESIAGVDSDNDGVRDDVERAIGLKYPNDAKMRAYHYLLAKRYQHIINNAGNDSIADSSSDDVVQVMHCLEKSAGSDSSHGVNFIIPITMNTDARTEAFISSLSRNAGKLIFPPKLEPCE